MNLTFALAISALAGCGVYMLLSRHVIRIIIGVAILSAAINLAILYSGRIASALPPVIPADISELGLDAANPLPQALILTAIVIGFALTAFASALALQFFTPEAALPGVVAAVWANVTGAVFSAIVRRKPIDDEVESSKTAVSV